MGVSSPELAVIGDLFLGGVAGGGLRAGLGSAAFVGGLPAEGGELLAELGRAEDVGVPEAAGVGPVDGGDGLVRGDAVDVDEAPHVGAPLGADAGALVAAVLDDGGEVLADAFDVVPG